MFARSVSRGAATSPSLGCQPQDFGVEETSPGGAASECLFSDNLRQFRAEPGCRPSGASRTCAIVTPDLRPGLDAAAPPGLSAACRIGGRRRTRRNSGLPGKIPSMKSGEMNRQRPRGMCDPQGGALSQQRTAMPQAMMDGRRRRWLRVKRCGLSTLTHRSGGHFGLSSGKRPGTPL
jgi:hypothetical protein